MNLPNIKISKQPGLGRPGVNQDAISGFLIGVELAADLETFTEFNKTITFRSLREAEAAFNITADNASAKVRSVHEILRRFYFSNPGTRVFLKVQKNDAVAEDAFISAHLPSFLENANGEIRQVAVVCLNSPTQILADMVSSAQTSAVDSFDKHAPVVVLLGLKNVPAAASAPDARDLVVEGNQVAVVISTDKAESQMPDYGFTLGVIASANVNENIGWVEKFPLTDNLNEIYQNAYFTNEILVDNISLADKEIYHQKGYIFARKHAGVSGYFFNSAPTAAPITNDEAFLENARTLNKAARVIRRDLLPRLNSPIRLNEDGTIDELVLSELEAVASVGLSEMQRNEEISAFNITIDPTPNFIQNNETIEIDFAVVPVGVARMIKGNVRLVANLT